MQLMGKVALVTGAGSGIGRAVAQSFAREGASVVALSRTSGPLEETVAAITAQGGTVIALPTDVTNSEQVQHAIHTAVTHYGGLHILFNGAGGSGHAFGDGPIDECSEAGWDATLEMNLKGIFLCCKYGIAALKATKAGGSVINLSSVLGLLGDAHFATHAYAASKAAVVGLTRAMAVYYAPENIRCNVLCPGLIETKMSQRAQQDPAVLASLGQWQPLGARLGTPEEVADVALFLASDASRFLTGVTVPVDGGWTAQ